MLDLMYTIFSFFGTFLHTSFSFVYIFYSKLLSTRVKCSYKIQLFWSRKILV